MHEDTVFGHRAEKHVHENSVGLSSATNICKLLLKWGYQTCTSLPFELSEFVSKEEWRLLLFTQRREETITTSALFYQTRLDWWSNSAALLRTHVINSDLWSFLLLTACCIHACMCMHVHACTPSLSPFPQFWWLCFQPNVGCCTCRYAPLSVLPSPTPSKFDLEHLHPLVSC